jgi:hypothetical protein
MFQPRNGREADSDMVVPNLHTKEFYYFTLLGLEFGA